MTFKNKTLKLSPTALQALNWWLQHIISKGIVKHNYYTALMLLTLAKLWEKKVHPKTAIIKQTTAIQLKEEQALALSLSFIAFEYFDAPGNYRGHLYMILQSLPTLRYDQEHRFEPPLLEETIAT